MRVAIHGLTKTGTTALYYKVKEAMPPDTIGYFEPGGRDLAHHLAREAARRLGFGTRRPTVAKFIPFYPGQAWPIDRFGHFDRNILIVRDPRDRFISRLLYQVFDSPAIRDRAAMARLHAMLVAKERNPQSVPLSRLLETIRGGDKPFDFREWSRDYADRSIARPLRFAADHPDYFAFRYEDLVDRNFAELGRYLGLNLAGAVTIDPRVDRVARTLGYGTWRHWFTATDIASFAPLLQPYLDAHYPGADWDLDPEPQISPAHGSGYLERIVNERYREFGLAPFVPAGAEV